MDNNKQKEEKSVITDLNEYLNPSPDALKDAKVKYCPTCKENRFTALQKCSHCGTSYQNGRSESTRLEFDPDSLGFEILHAQIDKKNRLILKKMIQGKYSIVEGHRPGKDDMGCMVEFKRVYCNLFTQKDLYAVTRDRYGYNLLVQPHQDGNIETFTLESLKNGDIVVKNKEYSFVLREINEL